jgi:hypothetical protein
MLTGCQQQSPMPQQNSVYYWRTEWHLDSVERNFLKQYDIQKVYCRYFDVVMRNDEPMPNATISFAEPVDPSLSIVPTVYITEDCMHSEHKGLAKKIVERIIQMNETNDVKQVKEIQIDCDYTGRSMKTYYQFLEDMRKIADQHDMRLSTTIRLHQLSMEVPPADYGVLMLYNTGNPQKYAERNPILDIRDVMPYISKLDDYALPLATAYPVFLWQRTIYGVHVDHWVEADEILKVKDVVEEKRPELRRTILTYHLDKENIKRYTPETYETIYHH